MLGSTKSSLWNESDNTVYKDVESTLEANLVLLELDSVNIYRLQLYHQCKFNNSIIKNNVIDLKKKNLT